MMMDKPQVTKNEEKAVLGTNTLPRKSKRRNRKKRPKTVAEINPPSVEACATQTVLNSGSKPSNAPVVANPPEQSTLTPSIESSTMDSSKDRDRIKAERETKRLAKQVKKVLPEVAKPAEQIKKSPVKEEPLKSPQPSSKPVQPPFKPQSKPESKSLAPKLENVDQTEKSRDDVMKEREARKAEKLAAKGKPKVKSEGQSVPQNTAKKEQPVKAEPILTKSNTDVEISEKLEKLHISENNADKSKPVLSKAERRAIQEAQRAAKAQIQTDKAVAAAAKNPPVKKPVAAKPVSGNKSDSKVAKKRYFLERKKPTLHQVKLFSHLYIDKKSTEDLLREMADDDIHPAIIQLGVQQSRGSVIGSNSRCIAFLNALKSVITDFVPPPQKIFSRSLETVIQTGTIYLQKCRPISVSMSNALKFVKSQINHLPDESEEELKSTLCESIDTYIRDQIEKAALAISHKVQEKISNGDVILTFGCSSLIKHILDEAQRRKVDFKVIVVDARPLNEGQEMLRRLVAEGINCTCVQINAVGFIMPEVTKVLLGAHALLANGYVMSRTGTAQVAMVAKSYNVPVLVCCETHKFSERVQTDAFVYNEIGNPNDLVLDIDSESKIEASLKSWESNAYLTPLHLYYDITPPELVAAVVTELAILPCTSVPVILRIKPTDMWF